MPRDEWKRATDRAHSRRAGAEYARNGRLSSYEYVYDDTNPPESRPTKRKASKKNKKKKIERLFRRADDARPNRASPSRRGVIFVTCAVCGCRVRLDRLKNHRLKVHELSPSPMGGDQRPTPFREAAGQCADRRENQDLATLQQVWPSLPDHVRKSILLLVDSARQSVGEARKS